MRVPQASSIQICRVSGLSLNVDKLAKAPTVLKTDHAGLLGEESVIRSQTHVEPWFENCSALPDQYCPPGHSLPGKTLDSETLGLAVPAVSGTPNSLLMCHEAPFT